MRIDTRLYHDVVIIQPRERITDANEGQFTEAIRTLLEAGPRRLVLDLSDVASVDSVALGAIVQAYTSTRRSGGDLRLLHVSPRNRQLLTITKLLTVLEAYDTEDEVGRSFDVESEESFSTGTDPS
jgi:anti-sigma B factor antagonist